MKFIRTNLRVSKSSYAIMLLAMLMFFVSLPATLQAQDDAATDTTTTTDGGVTETKTITATKSNKTTLDVIKEGGVWMIPLFLLSIAMVALIVNNFIMLQRKKLTREDLLPGLMDQLANRDIDGALATCNGNPSMMTNTLVGGLNRITTDEIHMDSIKEGIDQVGSSQIAKLIKTVNYLSNIGAVAPMVGLLGTVSGMIKAFHGMSMGAGVDADQMAANISEALVTTASGLVIAIPAMLFYFFFKNGFMESVTTTNAEIGRLLNTLHTGSTHYSDIGDGEFEG